MEILYCGESIQPTQVVDNKEQLQKEVERYKKRMYEYKASFFRVCNIVEHSDCHDIIKQLIKEERNKY